MAKRASQAAATGVSVLFLAAAGLFVVTQHLHRSAVCLALSRSEPASFALSLPAEQNESLSTQGDQRRHQHAVEHVTAASAALSRSPDSMDPQGLFHQPMPADKVRQSLPPRLARFHGVRAAARQIADGGSGAGGAVSDALPLDFEAEAAELAEVMAVQRYEDLASRQSDGSRQHAAKGGADGNASGGAAAAGGGRLAAPDKAGGGEAAAAAVELAQLAAGSGNGGGGTGGGAAAAAALPDSAERDATAGEELRLLRQRAWAADYIVGLDSQPQRASWPKVTIAALHACID